MWISAPTPVTTRTITSDSGSIRMSSDTLKLPDAIHSYSGLMNERDPAGWCETWMNVTRPVTKDAPIISVAIAPAPRPTRFPSSRRNTAPSNGKNGISQAVLTADGIRSPLHRLGVVDRRAGFPTEDGHDDPEADHDLGG